jgi:hypothetical protein
MGFVPEPEPELKPESPPAAWEPLTPRGVAAFARATSNRLFIVQFITAVIVALTIVWFIHDAWSPTIRDAITHLPDEGEIRGGVLNWRGDSPRLLAEGTFVAFSVDVDRSGEIRSPAHVQVELGKQELYVRSLLGYLEVKYPEEYVVAMNREELGPWWGAWEPPLLGLVALGVIAGLMVSWFALALMYALPVWLLVFFANRDLRPAECWRLAGAALMPGALLMVVGILLYDIGAIDLVGLGFVTAGHFFLGWIYLFICPLFLPRVSAAPKVGANPFATQKAK